MVGGHSERVLETHLASKISLRARNNGCTCSITPGATKTTVKTVKSLFCRSRTESPIIQNVKLCGSNERGKLLYLLSLTR